MKPPEQAITHLTSNDDRLAAVILHLGRIEYHANNNPFAYLVQTVIGQTISTKAANVIYKRVLELCQSDITSKAIGRLSADSLRSTGMSLRKASTILSIANNLDEHILRGFETADDEKVIAQITSIPGLGSWSAKMYLIFVLQRENVLPFEDGAFIQAYKWLYNARSLKPNSIIRRCSCWKPHQSIAARYMYRALDTGLTKMPIEDFLRLYRA